MRKKNREEEMKERSFKERNIIKADGRKYRSYNCKEMKIMFKIKSRQKIKSWKTI